MNLKHLALIKEWVSDMEKDPSIVWQVKFKSEAFWRDLPSTPSWCIDYEYRRKPINDEWRGQYITAQREGIKFEFLGGTGVWHRGEFKFDEPRSRYRIYTPKRVKETTAHIVRAAALSKLCHEWTFKGDTQDFEAELAKYGYKAVSPLVERWVDE